MNDKDKPLHLIKSPVYDIVDEVEPLYTGHTVVAPLIAKLKESFSILKQCYNESETSNDELEELLRQSLAREGESLARERDLMAIIRTLMKDSGSES